MRDHRREPAQRGEAFLLREGPLDALYGIGEGVERRREQPGILVLPAALGRQGDLFRQVPCRGGLTHDVGDRSHWAGDRARDRETQQCRQADGRRGHQRQLRIQRREET